ncbi:MAG: methyltransferase domain-containing protein [Candidatus Aegiribacteria sp.]|nr:methyltransferase domain-containing protein [Candidatus Aegiribacteria sp.]
MTEKNRRDWSEKDLKKHIVDQRKYLWRTSTIERIASWLDLGSCITAVDVGCGLGYLGWTFWQHYGCGSTYIGVDCSIKLLREAQETKQSWSEGGKAYFANGSAYAIPLPDESADWTMCQTLLMHLEFPRDALKEMIRVTKPGGVIMCMEPDNISSSLSMVSNSVHSPSIEEKLAQFKMQLIWAEGRKKLGRGDWGIGTKVPGMMADLGLINIDALNNDTPRFVHPPYETEIQKYGIEKMRENIKDKDDDTKKLLWKRYRECFLAGGGSLSTYYRYMKSVEARQKEWETIVLEQLENSSYYHGISGSHFFCIRGFKPEK